MASSSSLLRELHRLHRFARELQEQVERGPRQLKAQKDRVAREEQSLKDGQDALKKLKVSIHDKETSLKEKHQQIKKYELQRNQAAIKKEFDALQHQITDTRAECQKLEDDILTAMGAVDESTAKIPNLEQSLKKAREDFARFQKEYEPRLQGYREQLQGTLAQVKVQEQALPLAILEVYERQVSARGQDGLSLVKNRTCTTCCTEITIQHENDLLAGRLVQCKACGRVLYLEEEATTAKPEE
jgi:uncharacterized protein